VTNCQSCGRRLNRRNKAQTCFDRRTCDLPPVSTPGYSYYLPWLRVGKVDAVRPEPQQVTYDERGRPLNEEKAARVAMLQDGWSGAADL
jgi:hypothetical protein